MNGHCIICRCRNVAALSLAVVVELFLYPTPSCATQAVPVHYEHLGYTHPSPTIGSFLTGFADISSSYVGVLGVRSTNSRATQYDAFIYDAVTGQHLRTFSQPVPADNVNFRFASISIDGDIAVVGATYAHVPILGGGTAYNAGAAYVYDLNAGTLLHKLVSDTPNRNFLLGSSVDTLGDRIVVGGWGTAYVFDARTGAQLAELVPNTPSGQFGISVSISESAIVVGSNSDQSQGPFTGAAFTFDPQTFAQTSEFIPADAVAYDNFGFSVAVDGNYAIASGRSGAYVFDAQSGLEFAKLTLPGSTTYIDSVDIQGSTALLGNAALGTAMTFDWTSGVPVSQLVARGASPASNFGYTVSLAGSEALVAAVGKSYQFRIVPEPATGAIAMLFASGCAVLRTRKYSTSRRFGHADSP